MDLEDYLGAVVTGDEIILNGKYFDRTFGIVKQNSNIIFRELDLIKNNYQLMMGDRIILENSTQINNVCGLVLYDSLEKLPHFRVNSHYKLLRDLDENDFFDMLYEKFMDHLKNNSYLMLQ